MAELAIEWAAVPEGNQETQSEVGDVGDCACDGELEITIDDGLSAHGKSGKSRN